MSDLEVRFHLLGSVHPLFSRSLPTLRDVQSGRYGALPEASHPDLANDITILRADIKFLATKLSQINIDQVTNNADADRLIEAFDSLLSLFEDSVLDLKETGVVAATPQDTNCVALFPKLITLRSLQRQHDTKASDKDACATDHPKTSADEQSAMPENTTLVAKQIPQLRLGEVTFRINFPPPQKIAICRHTVESFGKVLNDIFPDAVGGWDVDSLLGEEVTDTDIEFIREAYTFGKASSSLFSLLVGRIACEAEHIAKLHLSGFYTPQLEMVMGAGEHDWILACFTHSTTTASLELKFEHQMCVHMTATECHRRTIRDCFNDATVWENNCILEHALYGLATATTSPSTLDHFLQEPSTQAKCRSKAKIPRFNLINRRIVGVLLACSLFKLCGSPWLQLRFERENIFVLPKETSASGLDDWRPHISCYLSPTPSPRSLPEDVAEDVAALGVLILELEKSRSAEWTEEDEDYETKTKSNKIRLFRILNEWKGDIIDDYHRVGCACFQFEKLVESCDNPKIDQGLRNLAVLYKYIVNPLFQKLVTEFGDAGRLFQGISGLSVPTIQKRASTIRRVLLYDDFESTEPDKKSEYADDLVRTLEGGFLPNIRGLRQNARPSLAETVRGNPTPEKIRIAVLDTGIDLADVMIKAAKSRIIQERSWVGSPENVTDNYGHGTHVTRLLLQMAPAAEIYVAKITDNKNVNPENMSRIADAINWAVQEWNVHIISMSFGFEDKNKAIDDAIEKAFKADKLMFAAASNEGGNKGRSRPSRSSNVICIHACDGKGNKGDMSPSPVKKKDNFTTLGVAVKSRWKKKTVYKSGTSFATPVAAAIAADVLEFANFKCKLSERDSILLYKKEGMLEVFRAMSTTRDNYDYVQPGHLWDAKDDEEVAKIIRDTLGEL